jgi:hypothetical protein
MDSNGPLNNRNRAGPTRVTDESCAEMPHDLPCRRVEMVFRFDRPPGGLATPLTRHPFAAINFGTARTACQIVTTRPETRNRSDSGLEC